MKRILMILFSGFLLLGFMTACGTIIHGTTQEVGVTSSPSGATVYINNSRIGESPITQSLSRGNTHAVKIELDGYQSFEMIINREVSGWVWGNIIFGGLIGLAVDAATGGMYKLNPEQINASLQESGISHLNGKGSDIDLFIVLTKEVGNDWEKIGNMEKY